eukprot:SAG31_NODE_34919_length_328_cov_0.572052_1_plen_85_part_01
MLFGYDMGTGRMTNPLPWKEAESACQTISAETHFASLTTPLQQSAAAELARTTLVVDELWIGLNDMDAAGGYVWTDDEPSGANQY